MTCQGPADATAIAQEALPPGPARDLMTDLRERGWLMVPAGQGAEVLAVIERHMAEKP